MSTVPKSKRRKNEDKPFVAETHFWKLRDDVTTLMLLDFGFDERKYGTLIEWYRKSHEAAENTEEVVERWKKKSDSFQRWFIDTECGKVGNILESIQTEFSLANSIHPAGETLFMEYCERRKHWDLAIGYCYALKHEMMYVIRVLPVNIEKFESYGKRIDKQIALIKGVRQSDNKILKKKRG